VSWNLKGWSAPISRIIAWKDSNQTGSWPSGLLRLYRSTSGLKSLLGTITWTGTPTITADGVTPGDGPSFGTLTRGNGKVFVVKARMTKASDGITGDEQILGPVYVRNGYVVAKVDGSEDTVAATWAAGDTLYAKVITGPETLAVEVMA
jgi:hypothetical protein